MTNAEHNPYELSEYRLSVIVSEHERLVGRTKDFERRQREGAEHLELADLIREIEVRTREHFASEELYLAAIGYSALAAHKRVHRHLLTELARHAATFAAAAQPDATKLIYFIDNWLLTHLSNGAGQHASFAAMSRAG